MPTFRLRRGAGDSRLRSGAPGDTLRYSVLLSVTGTDTVATAETLVRRNVEARPVPETRVLADVGTRRNVQGRPVPETLAEADVATRFTTRPRAIADTLAAADTVGRDYDPKRALAEALSVVDTWLRDYDPKRALAEQWSTGAGPIVDPLPPDYIRSAIHYVGTVAMIQDDPDASDASWIVDDGTQGELRMSFPQPAAALATGAGLQEFRIRIRPG